MPATVLIALTVPDADLGDLAEAVHARLDEFYPDSLGGFAVPLVRRVVATKPEVAKHLFDAAAVGMSHDPTGDLDVAAYNVLTALTTDVDGVATVY